MTNNTLTNGKKGKLGEVLVHDYLVSHGYSILPERRNGCDLIAVKDGKEIAIEVKTTSNLHGRIPDMHNTEFQCIGGQWMFVADMLFVVRLGSNNVPISLDVLTREEIDRYAPTHKTVIRIRTTSLDRDLFKGMVGKKIDLSKGFQ